MIEVEKKFQPTEEQLAKLLEGAEFLGEKVIHDVYYDFNDLRLYCNNIKLRNRNGAFELKIGKKIDGSETDQINDEIEDEEKIKEYFNTELPLQDFVDGNMIVFTDFVNNRKKYKKGEFNIDLDNMDYGYNLCEVELLVESEDLAENAVKKIMNLLYDIGVELKDIPSKRVMYLKLKKPELYAKIIKLWKN